MKMNLNLASRPYLNRRKLYLAYAVLGAALLLILLAQLNYCLQVYNQTNLLQGRVAELEKSLGISGGEAISEEDFKKLLARIEFSNTVIDRESYRWTALLSQLEVLVPNNVRITQIHPNFSEGSIDLTGQAKTVADLRSLLDNMFKSAEFSDAYLLRQAEAEPGPGQPKVIDFSLQVRGAIR